MAGGTVIRRESMRRVEARLLGGMALYAAVDVGYRIVVIRLPR